MSHALLRNAFIMKGNEVFYKHKNQPFVFCYLLSQL